MIFTCFLFFIKNIILLLNSGVMDLNKGSQAENNNI